MPAWRRTLAQALPGGRFAAAVPLLGALSLIAFGLVSSSPYWIRELSLIAVLALVVSGLNLSFGYAGALQFGQVFAFGLGCYATMILSIHVINELLVLMLVGGTVAAVAGAAIALPALRVGGWPLAITSLLVVMTIPDLAGIFSEATGGLNGLLDIPVPQLLGRPLDATGLYLVTVLAAIGWFALYRNLVTSRYGAMLRVLRESPLLAGSLGLSAARLRIVAYAAGAFPAGVAGCLFGFISLVVTPSQFGVTLAVGLVAASILGGSESVYGAIVGAAIIQLGPESSLSLDGYAPIAYGAFLIVAAITFRSGLSAPGAAVATRLGRCLSGSVAPEPADGTSSAVEIPPLHGLPLRVHALSKAFAGVHALDDVSLSAAPGTVTALIGANGSGKTTLLNVVCGYEQARRGSVRLGDADITGLSADAIARAGVARTFQTSTLPHGLSVLEVVATGRFVHDRPRMASCMLRLPRDRHARRADRREALAALELVGLRHLASQPATALSLGGRRLVEVARALCADPRVLLLDEPAAGLGTQETRRLGQVVTAVARAGCTVILIEHDLAFVAEVADVTHVLRFGRVIAGGAPGTVLKDPAVVESMVGHAAPVAARGRARRDVLLELRDVRAGHGELDVVRGVSLSLPHGSVEVLLGRNGAGKSTLLATIAGQLALRAGSITLDGREVGHLPAYRRAAAGIAFVPDGKRIFRERSVAENVALGTFSLSLGRRERAHLCSELLEQFPALLARRSERAGDLSGGQQQMLAICQGLAGRPRLLLLDEPSAGLAPAVVSEVLQSVRRVSEGGLGVLLVEQRVREALAIADHATVLGDGQVLPPSTDVSSAELVVSDG